MKFVAIFIIGIILVIIYGISEKERKEGLYKHFLSYKKIQCNDVVVQRGRGWYIHDNTYFTNKKIMRAIVYCKVL